MKKEYFILIGASVIFLIWYRKYKEKQKNEALKISEDDYNLVLMKNNELNRFYSTRHFYLKNYE